MDNYTEEFMNDTYFRVNDCESSLNKYSVATILTNRVLPIVVLGGILGIILTVIVLRRKTMCTSTNCYLTSLAFADLLFLVLLSLQLLIERIVGCDFYSQEKYIVIHHYGNIFQNSAHITSVWITVMLAVERYIAICYPLKAMAICTINRARCMIAILVISAFMCRIPNFFDMTPTIHKTNGSWIVEWNWNFDAYNIALHTFIVDCVLTAILPFIALTILNIRLILEIHKSSRYLRYHLAADSNVQTVISREQLKITVMLLIIILAFFPCQGPTIFYHAVEAIYKRFKVTESDKIFGDEKSYSQFLAAARILLALKSSLNFIIYCWFSEKFWNTFKRIFCLRYCLPKQLPKRNDCIHIREFPELS
ncbi:hypothetical protein LOTGIDRAFT_165255 [Lottia gigantea]|uniref:G-protein coupled receptors family 1 profile domain-containing protein n=1 Tax=Lottia gigantea TaxID=225164 RepID=V4A1S1_LOTGI|nr:hypothetical protein LOTGIDRAFT_165255 [Lottia gigantea]ESO88835.1 hypothetical protein LOTGIDRAFT_165255 [Lottia gigantea]